MLIVLQALCEMKYERVSVVPYEITIFILNVWYIGFRLRILKKN